jgi:hypothetical protein
VIFLWKSGSKLMAKNGSILLAIDSGEDFMSDGFVCVVVYYDKIRHIE